jgi:hypothetical protein
MFKKDRVWKFVYESNSYYVRDKKTLLVVAKSLVLATKEFYKIAGSGVSNIVEVTEVRYDEKGVINCGEK